MVNLIKNTCFIKHHLGLFLHLKYHFGHKKMDFSKMVIFPLEIPITFSENFTKKNGLHTIDKPIFKKCSILPLKIVST